MNNTNTEHVEQRKGDVGETDKFQKTSKIPLLFGEFEYGEQLCEQLIEKVHPFHGMIKIKFICRNIAKKKNKKPVPGSVYKVNPMYKHLTGQDFVIEIALDVWNEMNPQQREALVDHLMMRIDIVENEETGEIKCGLRSPDVQEFAEIVERHHSWTPELKTLEKSMSNGS